MGTKEDMMNKADEIIKKLDRILIILAGRGEKKEEKKEEIPEGYYRDRSGEIQKKPAWTKDYKKGFDPFDVMKL